MVLVFSAMPQLPPLALSLVLPLAVYLATPAPVYLEICSKRLMEIRRQMRIVEMMMMWERDLAVPQLTKEKLHLEIKERSLKSKERQLKRALTLKFSM